MPYQHGSFLLTYSNRDEKYLKKLEPERDEIQNTLLNVQDLYGVRPHQRVLNNPNDFIDLITKFQDNLLFFSYSGHANREELLLSEIQLNAVGCAQMLRSCKSLQCVLLNGCNTAAQVKYFLEADVPIVIATESSVIDEYAKDFAVYFFEALIQGVSIESAFDTAQRVVRVQSQREYVNRSTRDPEFDDYDDHELVYGIFYQEEKNAFLQLDLPALINFNKDYLFLHPTAIHNNILFVSPNLTKQDKERVEYYTEHYHSAFFNLAEYEHSAPLGIARLKSLLPKIGRIAVIVDHKHISYYQENQEDAVFKRCLELIRHHQTQRRLEIWMLVLQYNGGIQKLLMDYFVGIKKHPEHNSPPDYQGYPPNPMEAMMRDFIKPLDTERRLIVDTLQEIDLDTPKRIVQEFANQEQVFNLLLIEAVERSGWEVIIKFAISRIARSNPRLQLMPYPIINYSEVFTSLRGARYIFRTLSLTILKDFPNTSQSFSTFFLEDLHKKLRFSSIILIIRGINTEHKGFKYLKDAWKQTHDYLQNKPRTEGQLYWIAISESKERKNVWASIIPKLMPYIPKSLIVDQIEPAGVVQWKNQFEDRMAHVDLPDLNEFQKLEELVIFLCEHLNMTEHSTEIFKPENHNYAR